MEKIELDGYVIEHDYRNATITTPRGGSALFPVGAVVRAITAPRLVRAVEQAGEDPVKMREIGHGSSTLVVPVSVAKAWAQIPRRRLDSPRS